MSETASAIRELLDKHHEQQLIIAELRTVIHEIIHAAAFEFGFRGIPIPDSLKTAIARADTIKSGAHRESEAKSEFSRLHWGTNQP